MTLLLFLSVFQSRLRRLYRYASIEIATNRNPTTRVHAAAETTARWERRVFRDEYCNIISMSRRLQCEKPRLYDFITPTTLNSVHSSANPLTEYAIDDETRRDSECSSILIF